MRWHATVKSSLIYYFLSSASMAANSSSDVTDNDGVRRRVFEEISADHANSITELSSLCMACEKQGVTRMLLTKVFFFSVEVLRKVDTTFQRDCSYGIFLRTLRF